jgi:BirA family biotin operon repressor/biotin-[acetyl-CoA-carboxylase] ligase
VIVQSIRKNLKTKLIGKQIHYYKELGSTQELAIYLAENNSETINGTVILAEHQDRGRGRLNSKWISPGGGIWLSVILKPHMPAYKAPLLSFTAALAVCDTISEQTGLEPKVKWPNDVLINHKKVCGILLDIATKGTNIQYAVIGIGVNANVNIQKILPYLDVYRRSDLSITSLKNELSDKYVNRPVFLKVLFKRLEHYYGHLEREKNGALVILNRIEDRLEILNATVTIEESNKTVEGVVVGLGPHGSLLLKKNDGSLAEINYGDARMRVLY